MMDEQLTDKIKTIVADTYLSYYDIIGAEAFDVFLCLGEVCDFHFAVVSSFTNREVIKEKMCDLNQTITELF